jgi:ATP-binding cassette subfamily B protein
MTQGFRLYRRLWGEAREYRGHILGLFVLSLLSAVFALLTPLPLKIAVDDVVGARPVRGAVGALLPAGIAHSRTGVLLFAVGLFVLVAILRQLQQFGVVLLSTIAGQRLLLGFRSRLFRHAQRLSFAYHDARGTADSAYRIQYDAPAVPNVVVNGAIPLFTSATTVIGMIYVTATIDLELALVAATVAPALFLALRTYRRRLRERWHEAKRLESSALSVVQETLAALRVVKAFGREEHERDRFTGRSSASVQAKIRLSYAEGEFGLLVGGIIGVGGGVVLFLGTRRVLAGSLTLGNLVLIMGYLQQLYDPLRTASKKAGDLQDSLTSVERVYALMDQHPDLVDRPTARPLARAKGAVEFRAVCFSYDPERPVLHDVSFSAPPGARVGLAGPTGAGKTTLMSLLTRFYDPLSGEILLDGIDLRDLRLTDVRNQFAIVLQEPVLFSVSIAENIAYARPDASLAEIEAAAKAANADRFIRDLPGGYDTQVGERGMRLSGGERQRISLARAFLKDAPVLILDEPTSSVDMRTEALILDAMHRLMQDRTVFMIAHRLSTLEICDQRIEIQDGRLLPAPTTV